MAWNKCHTAGVAWLSSRCGNRFNLSVFWDVSVETAWLSRCTFPQCGRKKSMSFTTPIPHTPVSYFYPASPLYSLQAEPDATGSDYLQTASWHCVITGTTMGIVAGGVNAHLFLYPLTELHLERIALHTYSSNCMSVTWIRQYLTHKAFLIGFTDPYRLSYMLYRLI